MATIYLNIAGARVVGHVTPSINYKSVQVQPSVYDYIHGGNGRVAGTVKEARSPDDLPVRRRVRLHRKIDGMLIREQWSAADGSYAFNNIARQPYDVLAFDHTGNFNPVVAGNIVPEVMP